jgi:hypothetical protein
MGKADNGGGQMTKGLIQERGTGRWYQLVKVYGPAGACMERGTLRRYSVVKRYV